MKVFQKDIVLLPYPFTDLTGNKVRPAIIVSNNSYNGNSIDCVMLPLTNILKDEPYSLEIEQNHLTSGTLMKKSRIKTDKLFSIEKSKILMKIGSLHQGTFEEVKARMLTVF